MKIKILSSLLFIIALSFLSCSKVINNTTTVDKDLITYAGLKVKKENVFEVTRIEYKGLGKKKDTTTFFIKEVIAEAFKDLTNQTAYKKMRYKREKKTNPWEIKDVWTIKLTPYRLEEVEENVRIIKLISPFKINTRWNGNIANYLSEKIFLYKEINVSKILKYFTLDSVVTVIKEDDKNQVFTSRNYAEEKYRANIGLVYKKTIKVQKALNSNSGNWEPSEGTDITYELLSYSK